MCNKSAQYQSVCVYLPLLASGAIHSCTSHRANEPQTWSKVGYKQLLMNYLRAKWKRDACLHLTVLNVKIKNNNNWCERSCWWLLVIWTSEFFTKETRLPNRLWGAGRCPACRCIFHVYQIRRQSVSEQRLEHHQYNWINGPCSSLCRWT